MPGNVNETTVADDLIVGDERAVYADKAYDTRARRRRLKAAGIEDRILHRPHKSRALSPRQRRRNRLIGPLRAAVEPVFGTLKRSYGWARGAPSRPCRQCGSLPAPVRGLQPVPRRRADPLEAP